MKRNPELPKGVARLLLLGVGDDESHRNEGGAVTRTQRCDVCGIAGGQDAKGERVVFLKREKAANVAREKRVRCPDSGDAGTRETDIRMFLVNGLRRRTIFGGEYNNC